MNRVVRNRIRAKVLVTTKTGAAFEGVLWDFDRVALVLRNTVQLQAGASPAVPVDGELVVFVADVAHMQIL
jgi:small nuclear ribonucleoprotein (snRNP)-like protein